MQPDTLPKFLPSKESNFLGHEEVYQRESEDCWHIAPITYFPQHSDTLTKCNFDEQENRLKLECTETNEYYVYSFGGWAGSIDIVIVKKGTRAYEIAEEIKEEMQESPILDEELYWEYQEKYDRIEIEIEITWSDNKVITQWIDISENTYYNFSEKEIHEHIKCLVAEKNNNNVPVNVKVLRD